MEARDRIAQLDWWHTIEIAPGLLTPGPWDLRATAERIPWPGPLDGLRCLDVGTMDGFWAFELERRGAAEVVAIDVFEPRRETFPLAAELLGSRAEFRERCDGRECFVFNRRGLRKLAELGGFAVDVVTPILRDRYRAGPERPALRARAMYRLGVRGRSAAVRGRPVRPEA